MRKVYQKRLKKQGGNWNIIAQKTKQGQMLLSEIRTIMLSFFQHMQNHHFSDVIQIPTQNQMAQTWVLLHLQSSDNHVYLILVVNEVISYHRLLFFLVPSISSDHVPFFFFFLSFYIIESMSLQPSFFLNHLFLYTGAALFNIILSYSFPIFNCHPFHLAGGFLPYL